ncbi:hypothetical protein [Ectopseudomonas guguanensis]|uniref:hypothetical protein n=1 Tax=Ectopseudomonas guguanensis TaxID=1198456 RepID=UPI0028AF1D85|nr:hypothetical protein [Pseudomonas guguanensis]
MDFTDLGDGLYRYRGVEVRMVFTMESEGRVSKVSIHYPPELFSSPQQPDWLKGAWDSKADALVAAKQRAAEVIDRKLR